MTREGGRKILLVDDEEDLREVLVDLLSMRGYTVVCAEDGKEAFRQFRDETPDLVILDVMLPDMSGFEICKKLKSQSREEHIPVLMLTARRDIDSMVGGLGEAKADDYIMKPFRPEELLARIGAAFRMRELHEVVRGQNEALSLLSMTDDLTGLYNRRFLTRKMDEQITRLRNNSGILSCVLLDLDRFKEINDARGHLAGDEVLRKFAELLKNSLGPGDMAGRWGGDEFLVLFTPDAAKARGGAAEEIPIREWSSRVISLLETENLRLTGSPTPTRAGKSGAAISVGLSGGGATVLGPDAKLDPVQLIADLDALLYQAKEGGRSRVVFAEFNSAGRAGEQAKVSETGRRPLIFVLEDDEDICSIIRDMLSRHNVATELFQTAAEMTKALAAKTPDLIFLDMKLSDGDGMEICRELRKTPALQKTRISFLTAFTSEEIRDKAMACGADAFIMKPFTYSKFVEEVHRLLNLSA